MLVPNKLLLFEALKRMKGIVISRLCQLEEPPPAPPSSSTIRLAPIAIVPSGDIWTV